MNKKIIGFAAIPVLGISMLAVDAASARGLGMHFSASPEDIATHQEEMFTQKASILGVSVDEIKTAWSEGKKLQDIAKEKGITKEQLHERMKAAREVQMATHLKALVDKGVITQAQADKRAEHMHAKTEKGGGRVASPSQKNKGEQGKKHFPGMRVVNN